ncbi:alpha/beta fold hydrolase [Nioella nitratireducens]|uniref:alpha/beta fold hydrolase n=1 Tax=Nioella nitratireducens TaxID=1287720 RepID=UPI0008FD4A8F|nr:alpha/beta hydrolase [Nioella nitratireducens]
MTEQRQEVRARRVLYIPGFDPVPARKYRERYRRGGTEQAAISGYSLDLGPQRTKGYYGWSVETRIGGHITHADVEVLVWADIVKASMAHGIVATYWQLLRTAWAYVGSGALFRLMRLRKGPVIAALYPVLLLLGQLGLALCAAGLVGAGLFGGLYRASLAVDLAVAGPAAVVVMASVALAAGWAVAWGSLRWFKKRDPWLGWYLMHDYAFSAGHGGAYPPAQEARMRAFADRIDEALHADVEEVLVVGHSSGAYMAVSLLADLIRAGRVPDGGPKLALLSLGHVVPMVSFLPRADRLRADLAFLSTRDDITWLDVTAPGDGCSFALCDPVAVSGVAPEGQRWPLVISAAFTQTLSVERQKALRWQLFELHFQYLNAFDQPKDYDYFQITAGPLTLASRFADRAPSPGRITRPVNRYTSIA